MREVGKLILSDNNATMLHCKPPSQPAFRVSVLYFRPVFLAVLALVLVRPAISGAQTGPSPEVSPADTVLPSVEVFGEAPGEAPPRDLGPRQRLDEGELTGKAAPTLGETLESVMGVANASFGPSVGLPLIRGQHGPRTRVLLNGSGAHDASAVSPDHGVTVEPLLAEQVEVVRGPAAIVHGGGAIGGAVEVRDRRIPRAKLSAVETAIKLQKTVISSAGVFEIDGGVGPLMVHLDAHTRYSADMRVPGKAIDEAAIIEQFFLPPENNTDGYTANTQARQRGAGVGVGYVGDSGRLGIALSQYDQIYGIPAGPAHSHGTTPAPSENVSIDLTQRRVELEGEHDFDGGWLRHVQMRAVDSNYVHEERVNGVSETRFENDVTEAGGTVRHQLGEYVTTTTGLHSIEREFSALGLEAFVPRTRIRGQSAWWQADLSWSAWQLQFGVRGEFWKLRPEPQKTVFGSVIPREERNFTPTSSSLALRREIPGGSLTLSRWQAQRAPEVQELYALGPHLATRSFDWGNSELIPETLNGWDFGIDWAQGPVVVKGNIYHYETHDYIYQENAGVFWDMEKSLFKAACTDLRGCLPVQRYTQQDAGFRGYELEVRWSPLPDAAWRPELSLFTDRVVGRLADHTDVPRLPPRRVGWGLAIKPGDWDLSMRMTHGMAQRRPGINETPTEGYVRWDLAAVTQWSLDHMDGELHIALKNLSDAEIRNSSSFMRSYTPESGRALSLTCRIFF